MSTKCHNIDLSMKYFAWDEEKNAILKKERNISFEEVVVYIQDNKILDTIEHPNKKQYPNQKIYIINIHNYAYLVPFVTDNGKQFLKLIIPSRKMTKKYLGGEEDEKFQTR